MSIMTLLQSSVRDAHQRIEDLPLTRAMADGSVRRDDYCRSLTQLWFLHQTLEAELARHPELGCVYHTSMNRAEIAERDLAALGGVAGEPMLPETAAMEQQILQWSREMPWALLGCLYVFEGSRMGSMYLARSLAKALRVPPTPGHGLDYHADRIGERPQLWQRFKAAMDAVPMDEARLAQILDAATATFDGLHAVYAVLSHQDAELLAAARS